MGGFSKKEIYYTLDEADRLGVDDDLLSEVLLDEGFFGDIAWGVKDLFQGVGEEIKGVGGELGDIYRMVKSDLTGEKPSGKEEEEEAEPEPEKKICPYCGRDNTGVAAKTCPGCGCPGPECEVEGKPAEEPKKEEPKKKEPKEKREKPQSKKKSDPVTAMKKHIKKELAGREGMAGIVSKEDQALIDKMLKDEPEFFKNLSVQKHGTYYVILPKPKLKETGQEKRAKEINESIKFWIR